MHRDPMSPLVADEPATAHPGTGMDRVVRQSRRGLQWRLALLAAAGVVVAFATWRAVPRGLAVQRSD